MFALNPRLATWLATLLLFTFSACEKDDAILAPSEVLPPISSQTNQPSNSLSAVAIEAVREEFKNLTRKAQILRFNTTKNLTNEDELITSLDFQPLWYAATSTQLLDEEVIVVPVLPPMSETYDEYQGYKMLIYPEEDSHRFGVVYYESVEPELGSAEGFNGMITMIAEDGPVSIYGLVEQDLLTHMGFYDQNDDYITLDLSSTQKCGILRFLRALFGSGVNCYQFPRRRSAGGSSGSSGSGAWGSGGGGASDVFGGGLTGWFTVYSTGGGSGGSTGSTLYGGGSGEGRDGRSVSGIFAGENARDSESCQSNIQQTYRPIILGGSLAASDDPLEVPAFALMLHYGADWLDYFLSAHTIWTQNGHQDLMGVFQQVEGGQVVNHFNGVHPITEDAYTTLDDFAIIFTNMQTDYEHSIANCRMPRYTILDAMLELTSGFCESAMDQFESEFQLTLSEEEWNELFSTMEEVPPCGDQEAFAEWVFITLHPWMEFISSDAFEYFTENIDEIDLIESNDDSPPRRIPCFTEDDFTYIGEGIYINFYSYQYHWFQHSTGLTYRTNWTHFCLQFSSPYSTPSTVNKLENAFRLTINSAEASLLFFEETRGHGTIFDVEEIKETYETSLKAAIGGVFGRGATINTAPNGCPGVPITLFDTNC